MAAIQLTTSDWQWYIGGNPASSAIIGNDWANNNVISRVGRFQFTAPSTGATGVNLTLHSGGKGDDSHIQLRFYIGTSATSHVNGGPDSEYTGALTLGDDLLTFTGKADILLVPNQTYYLWVFPGENTYGWYWGYRVSYTSILTTSGAAMSVISGANGTLESSHTLTLTRYSNSLTHTISATCGSESLTIETGVQADSVTWTPPISWAAQNTTGPSVKVKITCTTYNGSTAVGSTSVTLTFAIPPSVVPTATISVSDKQGYFSKYGNYIQGKSQAQISASGDGAYGSTISSYSVVCGTTTKTGASPVFDLLTDGEIEFTVTVTDSRGRQASATVSITVVAYSSPTAAILAAYRSDAAGNQDDNGTYATVVFKANITPLGDKNSAKYTVKYRIKGTTMWTSVEVATQAGNYAPEGAVQVIPIQLDSSYELSVSAADDFSAVDSLYRTVQVAFFLISFNRANKAVGIGQKATEPGIAAFGIPAKFNAGVIADGKTLALVYNESVGGYVLMETIT